MGSRKSEKIVVVGGSHAAVSVIDALKRQGFPGKLTLISEEKVPVFSPTALPYLFWKHATNLHTIRPEAFYKGLDVIEDKVVSVVPEKSQVVLRNGTKIRYDRLVIATGASAVRLPISASGRNPLLTLRRIEDVKRIEQRAKRSRRILVIGAGLIGLHLAQVFAKRGRDVHVVELRRQVLPGLVCLELADLLKIYLQETGIHISLGVNLCEINDGAALFSDGEKVPCDVAVCAVGIKPNLELVQGTPIAVREGIVVNEAMETSVPGVYACGDVAEYRDFFTGKGRLNPNVISAAEQGIGVAENLMGKRNSHSGLISINVFNCLGSILFSLGRITADPEDTVFEEYNKDRRIFKRMIFQDGVLKGAVMFNSPLDGGLYYRLLRERVPLGGLEDEILREPLLWGKRIGERAFKD